MNPNRIKELRETVERYEQVIAVLNSVGERLRSERRGAADDARVALDQRLAANEQAIDTLSRTLQVTKSELELEIRKGPTG